MQTGNIDFDDSMSTKLLPGEKPRKKDIGTTSYKKPGPPTPSKNGGRLSLQSNEIQPPRDVQDFDSKTPKRSTPSRIKNLFFRGRNSTTKNSTEVGELEKKQSSTFLNSTLSPGDCNQTFFACSCTCHKKIVCVCPIGRKYVLENCCMKMIVTNIWCCTKHILALLSMIAATVYINNTGLNQIISL